MANQIKLRIAAEAILLRLYEAAHKGYSALKPDSVAREFSNQIKAPVVRLAISELTERGFVRFNPLDESAAITRGGFQHVENELDRTGSFLSTLEERGNTWLFETGGKIPDQTTTDDAAINKTADTPENKWEPLPLDRGNPALDQAIAKIEELTEAVAQDNGYAATEPDERAYILSALREGARALREQAVIYRMQFEAFVWEPIKKLTSRFGPSAIGLLATAAKELIKEGLKHAAKAWWNS